MAVTPNRPPDPALTGGVMTDPEVPVDCNVEPKLTADEWAYIEATTKDGDD